MKTFIVFIFSALIISCSDDGVSAPPDISVQELLATPETITVENKELFLSSYMWRDFMPFSPENGKPLIAITYVNTVDSSQIPTSISVDAVWIVYNGQVWKSWFSNQETLEPEIRPYRVVKIARDGPKWGPDVLVDVIARVIDGNGKTKLLRASKQYIGRTD